MPLFYFRAKESSKIYYTSPLKHTHTHSHTTHTHKHKQHVSKAHYQSTYNSNAYTSCVFEITARVDHYIVSDSILK